MKATDKKYTKLLELTCKFLMGWTEQVAWCQRVKVRNPNPILQMPSTVR